MIRSISILLVSILFFACGTKKKVVEASEPTTKEAVFTEEITEVQDSIVFHTDDTPKNPNIKMQLPLVEHTKEEPEVKLSIAFFDHSVWNTLVQKHVSNHGVVDYKGFKKDRAKIQKYITSLSEHMPLETWSKEAKLAYWMNAYNVMTVDLIVRNYPLKSIKDIDKPWNQRLWKLGEKWYNLDEIEHKILRKMNEPRIHFAINCASFSCPPLLNEAFSEGNLEVQLTEVTKTFLADSRRNTITKDKLEISKIFKWFSKDFKQNGSLIDFLNQYSNVKINASAKKNYKDYNWNLNE